MSLTQWPEARPPNSKHKFPRLTAVRLAVLAYEDDNAALERGLEGLSAEAVAAYRGGNGRRGANAFCLACVVDGEAWLAFRGSDDWTDWRKNLVFVARQGVHGGFLGEWLKLRGQVLTWLKANHAEVQRINLTGHSLGGAIAMIGAGEVFDLYPERFGQIVTFGAPPPFYASAAEAFGRKNVQGRPDDEALGHRTLRVVNQRDAVSWLPRIVGLRHVGELDRVGPPTFLGGLATFGARMFTIISGKESWGAPPAYKPEDAASVESIRRWSERETLRVAWRDGGFGILGIHLLRLASIILVPFWVTVYLVARLLVWILSIQWIIESGLSHLRRRYLNYIEPRPDYIEPRPAWHQIMDSASKIGRR